MNKQDAGDTDILHWLTTQAEEFASDWAADNQPVEQGGPGPSGAEYVNHFEMAADEMRRLQIAEDGLMRKADYFEGELTRLRVLNAELVEALEYAKPLVEKWCHYQGSAEAFHKETLAPIEAAIRKAKESGNG